MDELFLKDIMDFTKVGIFILDRSFRVVWINRAIEELFGIERKQVIGKDKKYLIEHTIKHLFEDPEEFASRVLATYRQNNYIENFICHILPGQGREERWVEHWSQPIYQGKYAGGRLEQYHDITTLKRVQDQLQTELKERELLLKEVHHRIKNNIASISSLLSLKSQSTPSRDAAIVLSETKYLLDSMAIVYEKLVQTGEYRQVSSKQYLEDLVASIRKTIPEHEAVQIETNIQEIVLDSKRTMWIGMILNELVTNSLKYAFQGKKEGRIKIDMKKDEQGVHFSVKDDGFGLPESFTLDSEGGFGFLLVRLLSEQLTGSLQIAGMGGTEVTIDFPV